MKVFLMYRDRDFDPEAEPPPQAEALVQDLELDTLFGAMAQGDSFLYEVAKTAILTSLTDLQTIAYRQHVLSDCLQQPAVVRDMYALAVEAIEKERSVWSFWTRTPDSILDRGVKVLGLFVESLRKLRGIADEHAGEFRSDGFARLFAMLAEELDDEYLRTLEKRLGELKFDRGVLISAALGKGNKGVDHVVREPRELGWRQRIGRGKPTSYSFTIPNRDENGFRALGELRGRGINEVANAVSQSAHHILDFFRLLRTELAFYIGCLNLHAQLAARNAPTCFPAPRDEHSVVFDARGLCDPSLTLNLSTRVVGNDVRAHGKRLVMITGANQGGKSTFLRSVGLAYLMTQSGMFVAAESLQVTVSSGLFTHFKREEDASMKRGKLDEELARMSEIADKIAPNSVLLCNESFAATNEREGSEIARQVVRAMIEEGVSVYFVTHMFDLAHGFYEEGLETALFLRAERQPDGTRTYRLIEGEPLPTSFGEDSYRRVFGQAADTMAVAGR